MRMLWAIGFLLTISLISSSLLFAQSNRWEFEKYKQKKMEELLNLIEEKKLQKQQALVDSMKAAKSASEDSVKKANPSPKAAWEDSVAASLERIAQGTAGHADSARAILAGKIQAPPQTINLKISNKDSSLNNNAGKYPKKAKPRIQK